MTAHQAALPLGTTQLIRLKKEAAMSTKTYYETVEARIAKEQDYKKLGILAKNIQRGITTDTDFPELAALRDAASHKAKLMRILTKCPKPSDNSLLEEIAFNNFVEGSAVMNKAPSSRVIHHQLKKLGYAKTAARQVERAIGSKVFQQMVKRGAIRNTSEYFVFKYARHLVTESTLKNLLAFSNENGQVLECA